jgi:hypothetical protein
MYRGKFTCVFNPVHAEWKETTEAKKRYFDYMLNFEALGKAMKILTLCIPNWVKHSKRFIYFGFEFENLMGPNKFKSSSIFHTYSTYLPRLFLVFLRFVVLDVFYFTGILRDSPVKFYGAPILRRFYAECPFKNY